VDRVILERVVSVLSRQNTTAASVALVLAVAVAE
jgi:hypothetical protein